MTKERIRDKVPKHTLGVMETGGGLARTKVLEFVKSNTTAKLITFGHGDVANYGGGYDQPTSYTFQPGHKAVLVITGWDPYRAFLDEAYNIGAVTDSTLSSDHYAFNIDNAAFQLRFPQVAK